MPTPADLHEKMCQLELREMPQGLAHRLEKESRPPNPVPPLPAEDSHHQLLLEKSPRTGAREALAVRELTL